MALAAPQGALEVERAEHAVLGRADRQLDERGPGATPRAPPAAAQCGHSAQGRRGRSANGQPSTTSSGGSRAAQGARAVDLAVPFSPRISTPPIAGLTAFSSSAIFIRSWPTMALKGYRRIDPT